MRGEARRDAKGRITGATLEEYVFNRLPKVVQANEYQEPKFDYKKRRDIVFVEGLPDPRTKVRISLNADNGGAGLDEVELIGPDLQVVERRGGELGVWEMVLDPGLYKIRLVHGGGEKYFTAIGDEVNEVFP